MTNQLFDRYLKNRKNETARLQEQLNKTANPREGYKDNRYWEPTVDKMGNGSAVIRFLPAVTEETDAYVVQISHSFKGPTGLWYIENCRSMLKNDGEAEADPVCEFIDPLWSGDAADKKKASEMKKKVHFISNILVIKDEKNPENEGKVFLFKYGKKLFEKLSKSMNLSDAQKEMGKTPVDPFDLLEGANLFLDVKKKDGFRNYDDSEFGNPGPVFKDQAKIAPLFEKMYDLKAEVSPDKIKSYEVLEKRLNKVLGLNNDKGSAAKVSAAKPVKAPVRETSRDDIPDDADEVEDVDALINELTK